MSDIKIFIMAAILTAIWTSKVFSYIDWDSVKKEKKRYEHINKRKKDKKTVSKISR